MIIQYTVLTAHHSSFIIPIHLLPYSIHIIWSCQMLDWTGLPWWYEKTGIVVTSGGRNYSIHIIQSRESSIDRSQQGRRNQIKSNQILDFGRSYNCIHQIHIRNEWNKVSNPRQVKQSMIPMQWCCASHDLRLEYCTGCRSGNARDWLVHAFKNQWVLSMCTCSLAISIVEIYYMGMCLLQETNTQFTFAGTSVETFRSKILPMIWHHMASHGMTWHELT